MKKVIVTGVSPESHIQYNGLQYSLGCIVEMDEACAEEYTRTKLCMDCNKLTPDDIEQIQKDAENNIKFRQKYMNRRGA